MAPDDDVDEPFDEVVPLEITGELDLHTFAPAEVAELVADYLDECAKKGLGEVRIVHGKGRGVLRRVVHGALARHPLVLAHRPDRTWGATLVTLKVG